MRKESGGDERDLEDHVGVVPNPISILLTHLQIFRSIS
jgi:hypothetical protein